MVNQVYESVRNLASITNGADATYYYYIPMQGMRYLGIQLTLSGGSGTCTVTLEGTCQLGEVDEASTLTYQDVTNALTGDPSFTASSILLIDTVNSLTFVRVKVVASTGGADDADWKIDIKQQN